MSSSIADLLQKQSKKHDEKIKVLAQEQTMVQEQTEADVTAIHKFILDQVDSNDVVVYSKSYCPYCRQAKMMLKSIPDLEFQVIEMDDGHHTGWQTQVADLAMIPERQTFPECVQGNNTKSVPQIFIHGKYVGGADDLTDLYTDGRLATLLNRTTLS